MKKGTGDPQVKDWALRAQVSWFRDMGTEHLIPCADHTCRSPRLRQGAPSQDAGGRRSCLLPGEARTLRSYACGPVLHHPPAGPILSLMATQAHGRFTGGPSDCSACQVTPTLALTQT